ncbi:MAG: DNA-binding HxlR family transcriptional regulator [Myxococcota bacterium]
MAKPAKKHRSSCPIAFAVDIIGDRWSLLIIRDLLFNGCRTYGNFLDAGEGIATNVLADRLKELERRGLVSKERDPDDQRRSLYSLSDKGRDLAPAVVELIYWSAVHDPESTLPAAYRERIESDRDGLITELRARSVSSS